MIEKFLSAIANGHVVEALFLGNALLSVETKMIEAFLSGIALLSVLLVAFIALVKIAKSIR